ncbi:hypothetical protein [Amycolatopsis sp. NBC_01480]|uniref:hypothetical protein n=1 Tax=Amycolatopsis sp. NBC_01480 TaxID=2903562 RepID=UPI002E2B85AB|nr:hypothetical protein [Amycolatopsis sp. NBC_01480]
MDPSRERVLHRDPLAQRGGRRPRPGVRGADRTADRGYALGVWESGVLADTLVTSPDSGGFGRPVLTDDGVIATTIGDTVATFRRSCTA